MGNNRRKRRLLSAGIGYTGALAGFALRSGKAAAGPVSVFIEPTNVCNLRCPECASGAGVLNRPKGRMSLDAFRRVIEALPSSVCELFLWGQGEPFRTPDFLDMVRAAADRGFRTVVSTNGHYLDDPEAVIRSGLDELVVSLDGIDAETYAAYRVGGDFDRVVDGVRGLAEAKRSLESGPAVVLQCLVTRDTVESARAFHAFAESLGADRAVLKTVQVLSPGSVPDCLPGAERASRYRVTADGSLETERTWPLRNRCLRIYYSFQIDWQGNILPCCFDKDSEFIMGNVFRDPVGDTWNSEDFRSFRRMLNRRGRVLDMCRNCTEGLKRKAVSVKHLA